VYFKDDLIPDADNPGKFADARFAGFCRTANSWHGRETGHNNGFTDTHFAWLAHVALQSPVAERLDCTSRSLR
jgi:hypothetical protein